MKFQVCRYLGKTLDEIGQMTVAELLGHQANEILERSRGR